MKEEVNDFIGFIDRITGLVDTIRELEDNQNEAELHKLRYLHKVCENFAYNLELIVKIKNLLEKN